MRLLAWWFTLVLAGCAPPEEAPKAPVRTSGTGGTPTTSTTDTAITPTGPLVPLFDASTPLERPVLEDVGYALITRFGDRGRDRHAREDVFAKYDHYLSHYWEFRTISAEIIDTVGRAADAGEVRFEVTTQYKLSDNEAELRFFYRGLNTVAEYHNNGVMTPISDTFYTRSVSVNGVTGQPLQVGDPMEFELSQFLDASVEAFGGRAAYYGTTYLYVVGEGLVPWQADTVLGTDTCPCDGEFSYPVPEPDWLGGHTTLPFGYSNEPRHQFMQMATNLAGDNAQPFVEGRRLVHTDFSDGRHSENDIEGGAIVDNPDFTEHIGKLGPHYIHASCDACHVQNTRALPPDVGTLLDQYVFRIGDGESGSDPERGSVLQGGDQLGVSEGTVTLAAWDDTPDGLRTPVYSFAGAAPTEDLGAKWGTETAERRYYEVISVPIPDGLVLEAGAFAQMPDGRLHLWVSRTVTTRPMRFGQPRKTNRSQPLAASLPSGMLEVGFLQEEVLHIVIPLIRNDIVTKVSTCAFTVGSWSFTGRSFTQRNSDIPLMHCYKRK